MPNLNKYIKEINSSALAAITDQHVKDILVKTLKAIEVYVCMAIIAMGLLQIISLRFSKELNSSSFRWLRTRTNEIVSEATVAYFFRKNIYRVKDFPNSCSTYADYLKSSIHNHLNFSAQFDLLEVGFFYTFPSLCSSPNDP